MVNDIRLVRLLKSQDIADSKYSVRPSYATLGSPNGIVLTQGSSLWPTTRVDNGPK